jgi:hypothetical protein
MRLLEDMRTYPPAPSLKGRGDKNAFQNIIFRPKKRGDKTVFHTIIFHITRMEDILNSPPFREGLGVGLLFIPSLSITGSSQNNPLPFYRRYPFSE